MGKNILGILNILLFIPFGFFVYAVLKNYNAGVRTTLTVLISMLLTLSIEAIQLASYSGRFEVADIAANTLGGLIGCIPGYFMFDLIMRENSK